MSTEVKRLSETIQVTNASRVLVTDIVAVGGRQVRSIRIFGEDGGTFPVLEIQLDAETADAIKITTPEIKF